MGGKVVDFPFELLTRIFKYVPDQTQIACQQVCKSWFYPARKLFYSTIGTENNKNIEKLVYCLEHSSAGDMVKLLKIDTHLGLNQDQFTRLIHACSNLQELYICNNALLYKWIIEAKKNLTLDKLRAITPLGRQSWRLTEQNFFFYLVAHKFRGSIESLHIPCTNSSVFDNNFKSTQDYLSNFANLKELSIIDGSMNNMVYFDELINVCTRLEKLNMQLGHPLHNSSTTKTVNYRHTATTSYPSLHTLDIFQTKFCTEYMRYMMSRFVNMESWTVSINQCSGDWIKDSENIERFLIAEYIPFVKKLSASALTIKMNESFPIGDFFSFYLRMYRNAKIDSQFHIENSRSERTSISLETQHSNYLSANYTFLKDFSFGSTELPFVKHLTSYGSQIDRLAIRLCKSVKRAIDLGFIIKQCPNAQQIEIDIAQQQPREYSWCSLLDMYNSKPNILWNSNSGCNDTISVLKISGGMITDTLLNDISNGLHYLEKLSLMCCIFQPRDDPSDSVSRFDMTSIHLKEFELDTSMFYHPIRQFTQVVIFSLVEEKCNYFIFDKSQFKCVSVFDFINHCDSLKQNDNSYILTLYFEFKRVEIIKVHIGRCIQQQVVETIHL